MGEKIPNPRIYDDADEMSGCITLWDLFASAALAGICAQADFADRTFEHDAELAAAVADALLAERGKRGG